MRLLPAEFASSRSVRCSLKRGLARRALDGALHDDANLPEVTGMMRASGRGNVALGRARRRILGQPGVLRTGLLPEGRGLSVTLRNWRQIVTRFNGEPVFSEPAIIYTLAVYEAGRTVSRLKLARASFSPHALERLVERTALSLDMPLLVAVDREASMVLAALLDKASIEDEGDFYISAFQPGVWARNLDQEEPEPDLAACLPGEASLPLFSVRTFLSPDEMRPTLWLRWRRDTRMTMDEKA